MKRRVTAININNKPHSREKKITTDTADGVFRGKTTELGPVGSDIKNELDDLKQPDSNTFDHLFEKN